MMGPKKLKASPKTSSLLLPTLSEIIPAGISINILERNHEETTKPTRIPEGSRVFASIGRNDADRLIPVIILNPMKRSSK
jgi:hypothetical protein